MLFWSLRPGSARIYWPQYSCSQPWRCDLDTGRFDALEGQVGDTKTIIDDAKSSSALSTVRSRLKVVASRLLANRSDATKQQPKANAEQSAVQAAINAAFDFLKFAMYRFNKFYTRIARCCRSRTCSLHRSSAPCSEAGSSEPCSQKFGAVLRNRHFCAVIEGRKLCAALRGPAS